MPSLTTVPCGATKDYRTPKNPQNQKKSESSGRQNDDEKAMNGSLTKTLSENRQVEQYMGTGQLNQGQPVLRLLGPASAQTATLEEPGDRPLHHPSSRRMRLAVGVRFLGGLVARFG